MPKVPLEERRTACAVKLAARAGELGRLPNKSDFSGEDVSAIKQVLGPWPRALEAAGLKPPHPPKQQREKPRTHPNQSAN